MIIDAYIVAVYSLQFAEANARNKVTYEVSSFIMISTYHNMVTPVGKVNKNMKSPSQQ